MREDTHAGPLNSGTLSQWAKSSVSGAHLWTHFNA